VEFCKLASLLNLNLKCSFISALKVEKGDVGEYISTAIALSIFLLQLFQVINFLGCLSLSLSCAFILTLTVELPFIFVEKLLVGKLLEWIKSMAAPAASTGPDAPSAPKAKINQPKEISQEKANGHTVDIKEHTEQGKTLPDEAFDNK